MNNFSWIKERFLEFKLQKSIETFFFREWEKKIKKEIASEVSTAQMDFMPIIPCEEISIALFDEPEKTKIIIERLINKSSTPYKYLTDHVFCKINSFVSSNSGNYENAMDVLHEALFIVHKKILLGTLDIKTTFDAYFFAIVRNLWIKELKRRKIERSIIEYKEAIEQSTLPEEFTETPDNYALTQKAMESLGESCRVLLEKYYFQKKSWNEIAEELGYSTAASARNQKYKCLKKIKKDMSAWQAI